MRLAHCTGRRGLKPSSIERSPSPHSETLITTSLMYKGKAHRDDQRLPRDRGGELSRIKNATKIGMNDSTDKLRDTSVIPTPAYTEPAQLHRPCSELVRRKGSQ